MTAKEFNLFQDLFNYIDLLEKEAGDYAVELHARGRGSSRVKEGRRMREKIRASKDAVLDELASATDNSKEFYVASILLVSQPHKGLPEVLEEEELGFEEEVKAVEKIIQDNEKELWQSKIEDLFLNVHDLGWEKGFKAAFKRFDNMINNELK